MRSAPASATWRQGLWSELRDFGVTVLSWLVVMVAVGLIAVAVSAVGGGASGSDRPASFCDRPDCIPSFYEGSGSIVQCADGQWSRSGGNQGACSHHGGVR
jgi:hypothetical protein